MSSYVTVNVDTYVNVDSDDVLLETIKGHLK